MGSKQITFKEGASLNRINPGAWNAIIKGPGAWNAIIKGPFIPVQGELIPKESDEMRYDEKRKGQDDQKAKNILTFGLSSDEFFHTARCKSAK